MTPRRIVPLIAALMVFAAACATASDEVSLDARAKGVEKKRGTTSTTTTSPTGAPTDDAAAEKAEDPDLEDDSNYRKVKTSELGEVCSRPLQAGQSNEFRIEGRVQIVGDDITLKGLCRVILVGDARLTFRRTNLAVQGGGLYIQDDPDTAGSNLVRFRRSTFLSLGDAGFAVALSDSNDKVVASDSAFSFPRSVWFQALGIRGIQATGGGEIRIRRAELTSKGDKSEGVQILASSTNGKIIIDRVDIEADAIPSILAANCKATKLTGAPPECGPVPLPN